MGASAAVVRDRFFVVVGGFIDKGVVASDMAVLDLDEMAWVQQAVIGFPPPHVHSTPPVLVDGKIFLFGGWDGRGTAGTTCVLDTGNQPALVMS
jgi:hypothetical protein